MARAPDDPETRRRQVALFRHAIIGELDIEALPRGERSARLAELAARTYQTPDGRERRFSVRTLWTWWSAYQRTGLEGLLPKVRKDHGQPKAVDRALLEAAITLRREVPSRSTATLIHILQTAGRIVPGQLRRSTLDRHLAAAGMARRRLRTLGDKRYIRLLFQRPNQLWVGDYHEAPLLWDPAHQRFRTLHLGAMIDHYSKLVPHGQWYRSEQLATLEDTLKQAVLKRGLPGGLYVDLGAAYRADQFAFACAHLGIRLRHSKPYASEGRGAIERWNRTVAEQVEPEIRALRLADLQEIQLRFEAWLEQRYHLTVHEATGQTPLDRFAQPDFTPRYPDPGLVAETFRIRVRRRVHPKTSTVEVEGVAFLVEPHLRGRWVDVHYDPHDLADVLVVLGGARVQRALPRASRFAEGTIMKLRLVAMFVILDVVLIVSSPGLVSAQLTGYGWRNLPEDRRFWYVIGAYDGTQLPQHLDRDLFPSAPKSPTNMHLEGISACMKDTPRDQVVAMVEKYVRDHPAEWLRPMPLLLFSTLSEACPP